MREFLEDLSEVASAEDMRAALARCAEGLGFPLFAYVTVQLPDERWPTADLPFFLTNLPAGWVSRYRSRNYVGIDPVYQRCSSGLTPLVWDARSGRLGGLDRLTEDQRRLLSEMRESGIVCGVTTPVHGPGNEFGLLSMILDRADPARVCADGDLHRALLQIAAKTHAVVTRTLMPPTVPESHCLTDRERLCLQWTAKGKTSWEISRILGRTESVVNFHLKNAVAKLNASNKCHAAVMATRRGLIEV